MSSNNRLLHLGIGAFHRGHQAYYLHLLNQQLPESERWFYTSINLRKETQAMPAQLKQQSGQYHLKRIAPNGDTTYLKIEAIDRIEDASERPAVIAQLFAERQTKAATITVTEGGYYLTEDDNLNLDHAEIKHDLAATKNAANAPLTLYGFLAAGLLARYHANAGPITVLSCDNLRDNGQKLKRAFEQFLIHANLDSLKQWTSENVRFPCSMVDRITPIPPDSLIEEIQTQLKETDYCPVLGEDFQQWVIENNLTHPFPPLEKVGVIITDDVYIYEEAKIRVLNGGHFLLCYVAALRGYEYFHQAIQDAELQQWLKQYHCDEVFPTLPNTPFDIEAYRQTIVSRFSNPHIADSVARITADSISKFPQFILPTLARSLAMGHMPTAAIRLLAHWYCFLVLVASGRLQFNYQDAYFPLVKQWLDQPDPAIAFLDEKAIWSETTTQYPEFRERLYTALVSTFNSYGEQYP
ncbi:mannitol dehydrogenase family protein [Thaumasiovibrio subtropicus]|uniref:mannitol dehydrogenase family protein n=1 Tax=Thaumasiovibrio subtropicus TaxID=1891207 RepID=UPI000B35FC2B|nr:mannitol dehydrogenase family protein [Thaumasiovibrio subtropicus]